MHVCGTNAELQSREGRLSASGLEQPVGCEVWLLLKASKARVMSTDVNASSLSLALPPHFGAWHKRPLP